MKDHVSERGPVWGLTRFVESIGADASDSEDVRLQKRLLVAVVLHIVPAAVLWGALYLAFDEPLAASFPFAYAFASVLSIITFGLRGGLRLFRSVQLLLILAVPFLLMLQLGGFASSGGVVLWSLIAPVGALVLSGRRQAVGWFVAFLMLAVFSGLLESSSSSNNLPSALVAAFFALNIVGVSLVVFVLLQYFLGQKDIAQRLLQEEQEKSDRLLLNVLPAEIAPRLKNGDSTIADSFDVVSVLFADVVGFTGLSARLAPKRMVELLNEVFSEFDSLTEKYGLEKIRTIGDNYMVASGVPRPRDDHAHALARLALEMNGYWDRLSNGDVDLQFRIGMNSGSAVAGVIGQQKFHYDLWGDAVNIASRMESHGLPGKIQIAEPTYDLIRDDFVCTPRGKIDVKGKGEMETWFLEGNRKA